MLTQKKIRSRRDVTLLTVMVCSLAISAYLVYVNVHYFVARTKANQRTFDPTMMARVTQTETNYKNVEWQVLGSHLNVLTTVQQLGLEQRVNPLTVDSQLRGRPTVFTRVNGQDL
ncbi:hypothetical protein HY933_01920 [Candidatus Falkowbacteria bacterium]|nr:hypothetical protein [Candidatus Falkowbacteria bacterium]